MKISFLDCMGAAGCASLTYGAWSIYHPAGFVVAGVLLIAITLACARDLKAPGQQG
jgi:hypothetical protein